MNSNIFITTSSQDYELLDSGDGYKLERFGSVVVSRPDPQVLWSKSRDFLWKDAHATFIKGWNGKKNIPDDWVITVEGITFSLRPASFKHVGIFPEQTPNWKWISEKIRKESREISVLNLFGYTGGASLAALKAGAKVVHVDGSKISIGIAKENAKRLNLSDASIRFILDDALAFAKREVRRGNTYDGIVMDPPAFGHGPDGEVWNIEKHLPELIEVCKSLLSSKPLFLVVNGYAAGYSPIGYSNLLKSFLGQFGGKIEAGELAIEESLSGRLLPAGICARWSSL